MPDSSKSETTPGPAAHPQHALPAPHEPQQISDTRPDVVIFKNVCKRFGHGPDSRLALENVSFVVEDAPNVGELVTVVGPSGCGKSTLLRIIAGLKPHFPQTSGEVLIFDKPVQQAGPDRGLVDQKYSLLPHLTVIENIAFGLRLRGTPKAERMEKAVQWLKKVGLEGCDTKYPSEL